MTFGSWTDASHKPLVIAHRGGALLAAENSAEAFRAAEAAGADAVETDVRVTADGVHVCVHDADLQRLCGDPRTVAELDLATLRQLLPSVMTLPEAISASYPLGLLLDVKLMEETHLPAIIASVASAGATARTILGLRDVALIRAARGMAADMAILALVSDPDSAVNARLAGANWFRLWQGALTEERAKSVRESGLRLAIMVGQPRSVPLPEYPPYPVGKVDGDGLARIAESLPDAIMLDDPKLLA
ncbi:glycerophosphodiester phosphodiesterase family protein [Rhizobium sp. BK376]|uniref:glycerophosphodiester phosphodiesterase n=1 Tax=Rhizobium sp. BK376 TaxID=2512149 RepID=UPI00104F3EF3|nr:glycerophosphodiester phosphodiesterase family protein [Rhizobium sp. BK376]TCR91038.1 glycerophosphoryl diester phosphodiesterase [Rhizobium sp. BK376]